jgi:WD40 repeat protein
MSIRNKNIHLLGSEIYDNSNKIFDIKYNQITNDLYLTDIKGVVKILSTDLQISKKFKISEDSLLSIDVSSNGELFATCGSDRTLYLVQNNSKVIMKKTNAHSKVISKVCFLDNNSFNPQKLATSAESGEIKIWDLRQKSEIFTFKEQSEEITDMCYSPNHNYLLATSIDGTLGVYDIRKESKYKLYALSDCIEDELTCIQLCDNGQRVVCGTSEGPVVLFNWDWFGDFKDRILGHPGSVNCLTKINENTLLSGCEDGGIRFLTLHPKRINSMISEKENKITKNRSFNDITAMTYNSERKLLAVTSNINYVKVFDIAEIGLDNDEPLGEAEEEIGNENVQDSDDFEDEEDEEEEISLDGEDNSENKEEADSKADKNAQDDDNLEEEKEEHYQELENKSSNSDFSDSSSSNANFKKKENIKSDKTLKIKALGKKRHSDWLVDKERRKDFFSDM